MNVNVLIKIIRSYSYGKNLLLKLNKGQALLMFIEKSYRIFAV